MKHLRKLLIALLGGIMMTGMLVGCDNSKTVEEELQPMFEILDKQEISDYDILELKDTLNVYGNDSNQGFQLDLVKNNIGELTGTGYNFSKSEDSGYEASYINSELSIATADQDLLNFQLLFEQFHFSSDYFSNLKLEKVSDSFERYDKIMNFQERTPSTFTKNLIETFGLKNAAPATLEIEKARYNTNTTYRYILSYSLKADNNFWIMRTFVFILEEENE